jgi:hypothetical protein
LVVTVLCAGAPEFTAVQLTLIIDHDSFNIVHLKPGLLFTLLSDCKCCRNAWSGATMANDRLCWLFMLTSYYCK